MDSQSAPTNRSEKAARKLPAAATNAAMALEEHLLWPAGDALRAIAEIVKWPFERFAWALQRSVLWPVEDRAGTLSGRTRAVSFGAVVLLAALVGVGALLWAAPGNPHAPLATAAATTSQPLAVTKAATPATPAAPTLHGVAPVFKPAASAGASAVGSGRAIENSTSSSAAAASAASSEIATSGAASSSTAQTSQLDGPPAGPAAVSVAREFAGAFVLYETGRDAATVRKAFGQTATPELSHSLLRRPPRLPANVTVPKAKVVNVVAGPSHGGVYSLSVSLLRVGVTSELRLEMEQLKNKQWQVTNVLG
jgi:hypothetical protein